MVYTYDDTLSRQLAFYFDIDEQLICVAYIYDILYEPGTGTPYAKESISDKQELTTGEKNALETAKLYLVTMPFSYGGLVEQLEFEGYTHAEAVYGADNCSADWNEQAAKSAASYLEIMSFSRDGLIEQLEYEGFTHEQAVYGVEQNGY